MYRLIAILIMGSVVLSLPSCSRDSARATQNINDLHNCALLVRLPNLDDKVEKLNRAQKFKKAESVQKYNRKHNLAIMEDFKTNYDFSDVYFFLSDDTQKVKSGNTDGIFLNENLIKDPSKKLNCINYLIMDYGHIQEDAATKMSEKWFIKDKNFNLLSRPFPYSLIWGKKKDEVAKFNRRFHFYYKDVNE